jgi:hypothetical protein
MVWPQAVPGVAVWQAPAPSHLPVLPQVLLGSTVQVESTVFSGTALQIPAVFPGAAQDLHCPQDVEDVQQTPSMQVRLVPHSLVAVHGAPWPAFSHLWLVVLHPNPLPWSQSASVEQLAKQILVVLEQRYGEHGVVTWLHVPEPLHLPAAVLESRSVEHDVVPHASSLCDWQPVPLGSHRFFAPHATLVLQAAEQQINPEPSLTQLPEPHSLPAEQLWLFFFLHFPPVHA